MSKNSDNFKKIVMHDDILEHVGTFKAIVGQGKKRPILSKEDHQALVYNKYDHARTLDDHITLFRVEDKKNLTPKEIKNHTVPGPEWTPPSSVGFVLGALREAGRIWSATTPTGDKHGLLGKKGKPSIFARETMSTIEFGWMAREPQENEKYGHTKKGPVVVFTPPSSPRDVPTEELKSIMNVNAGWDVLPLQLNNLIKLSTPLPKALTDSLKKSLLTRKDLDDSLLKAPIDVVRELLQEKEVIALLSSGAAQFDELITIYLEYIDGSDNHIGEFSFQKLHSLLAGGDQNEFESLFFRLNFSISDIIKLYNDNYDMFCAFADDKFISFFQEYREEINIEKMARIYHDDQELFYALINDSENVLHDTGIEGFISGYQRAQLSISETAEDDPYYGAHDAYDELRAHVVEDGCPKEFLQDNDSSDDESDAGENYYERQADYDTDEDSVDYLIDLLSKHHIASDSEDEERGDYTQIHNSSDNTDIRLGRSSIWYDTDES